MARKDKLSHQEFSRLVDRALDSIPDEFRFFLENVVVMVEEEPPVDMPDVMGLYEGVPLVDRSTGDTILPDCITLYKGPIERACRSRSQVEAEIRDTLLHEIGHFFGLDELQLEKL
ncbi:metallopeptidase family protein [Chloroflexota bacterium]